MFRANAVHVIWQIYDVPVTALKPWDSYEAFALPSQDDFGHGSLLADVADTTDVLAEFCSPVENSIDHCVTSGAHYSSEH
jgi:hypothetical protein